MKKTVTVIGAGGQRGQWGTKEVASKNVEVTGYDSEKKISGKFTGLYGDILVVENGQKQFMLSLKKIIGHRVELTDDIESLSFEPQQISLF